MLKKSESRVRLLFAPKAKHSQNDSVVTKIRIRVRVFAHILSMSCDLNVAAMLLLKIGTKKDYNFCKKSVAKCKKV